MNFEYFDNSKTNTRYIRVTKQVARRAFNGGITVIIAPVKVNPYFCNGALLHFCERNFDNDFEPSGAFERVCNSIIYYNCNSELGKYLKYYLPKNIALKYGYKVV